MAIIDSSEKEWPDAVALKTAWMEGYETAQRQVADQEAEIARLRARLDAETLGSELATENEIRWMRLHEKTERELAGERSARTHLEAQIRELQDRWVLKADERVNRGGGLLKHSERTIATLRACSGELSALLAAPHREQKHEDHARVEPRKAGADGQDPPRSRN